MINYFKILLFFLIAIISNPIFSQIVGGRANGEQAPRTVEAAALSKGGSSGNVNLFNGTYGSSYELGTVSTEGGLSFTASLNYASSFSAGDNLTNISGIPYGEGWSMNIPRITITTEDYHKYTLQELKQMAFDHPSGGNDVQPLLFGNDMNKEGGLMWFAPTLNIPGIASGRMVYKYTKKINGMDKSVFVLHKFDKYIEAHFDGQYWNVILEDGTEYEFLFRQANQRAANNQRMQDGSAGKGITRGISEIKGQINPKTEVTSWYVNKISHPNKEGKIDFTYETFGVFNMFREYGQEAIADALSPYQFGGMQHLTKNLFKDIFVEEISSSIEKLVFTHKSLYNHGLTNTGVYEVDDSAITRRDSLYSSKTIYSSLDNWNRYLHLKSQDVQDVLPIDFSQNTMTVNNTYSIGATNPYIGSQVSSSTTHPGLYTKPHLVREPAGSPIGSGLNFKHGFLESPRLENFNFRSGDMYEIKTRINGGQPLFDINIVSGDKTIHDRYYQTSTISGNTIGSNPANKSRRPSDPKYLVHAGTYKAQRLETVYSTFNSPVKWGVHANPHNHVSTSNYFVMPNQHSDLKGYWIQVGPSNSDVDYSTDLDLMLLYSDYDNGPAGTSGIPGTGYSYAYHQFANHTTSGVYNPNPYMEGQPVSANFGVGMPWHMMSNIYGDYSSLIDYTSNGVNATYTAFWWNNIPAWPVFQNTPNLPTLSHNSNLASVEIIHHAKNPYMLHEVAHYKMNGLNATTNIDEGWTLINKLRFSYETKQVNNYPTYQDPSSNIKQNLTDITGNKTRTMVLLKSIQQLPRTGTPQNSNLPTTHFEYDDIVYGNTLSSSYTNNFSINIDYPLLTKVINPLGLETTIDYKSDPVVISSFYKRFSPNVCFYCSDYSPNIPLDIPGSSTNQTISVKGGEPYAYTINMLVDQVTILDDNGTRCWNYSYTGLKKFNTAPAMPANIARQINPKIEFGYAETRVDQPELTPGNRPYIKYQHHSISADIDVSLDATTENDLLWGKLLKTEHFDGQSRILSKTENTYDYLKAFLSGTQRTLHDQATLAYGNQGHDYVDLLIPGLGNSVPPLDINGVSYEYQYENHINQNHPYYNNSYFIKLSQSKQTTYDENTTGGWASIEMITDYEYFDANHQGLTDCDGYEILLYGNSDWNQNGNQQLQWEPSWQLYKKKTYSPQLPDAYKQTEYFYYYDLINQEDFPISLNYGLHNPYGNLDDGNDGQFYPVHWSYKYHMRNIVFEERVTQKTTGLGEVRNSNYFEFSNEWNDVDFETTDLTDVITISTCSGNGGGTPTNDCTVFVPGCFMPGTICSHSSPPAGLVTKYINGCCYWCDEQIANGGADSLMRYIDLGYPHKDNLFYSATSVKTTNALESTYSNTFNTHNAKYEILRFVDDGQNKNNFLPVYPYQVIETHRVLERNIFGEVQLEQDAMEKQTRYLYSDHKTQTYEYCHDGSMVDYELHLMTLVNAPIAVVEGAGHIDSLITYFDYHEDYSIAKITEPNGKEITYAYDDFGRMNESFLNGDKLATITYQQWNNNKALSFQQKTLQNYVESTSFNDRAGNSLNKSRAYIDPLSRANIVATHKGSTPGELTVTGGVDYDNWDRKTKTYKSYAQTGGFSNLQYDNHLNSNIQFMEHQYDSDPRSRMLKSSDIGESITGAKTTDKEYIIIRASGITADLNLTTAEQVYLFQNQGNAMKFYRVKTTDQDDKISYSYQDPFGKQIATKEFDGTNNIVTLFVYDSKGNLVRSINPEKQSTFYSYNLLGKIYEQQTVDNGLTKYMYNKLGQVTYIQDKNGATDPKPYMRGIKYDDFNRTIRQDKIESGSVFNSFSGTKSMHWHNPAALAVDAIYEANAVPEKRFYYDETFDPMDPYFSSEARIKLVDIQRIKGKMSHMISYNNAGLPIEFRMMSYNPENLMEWEIVQFNEEGITSIDYGSTNVIHYPDYNLKGSLKTQNVDLNGDETLDLQYHYTYDEYNRLDEVYANYIDNRDNGHRVAKYEYDEVEGKVKKLKYYASNENATNIEVDETIYDYDVRGRMKEIESALFRWNLYYDNTNIVGVNASNNWNGNVNSSIAKYKFSNVSNVAFLAAFASQSSYGYQYDGINRLKVADAHGVQASNNLLGDATYQYDKIGNLTNLTRKVKQNGSIFNQAYLYNYTANTNQLASVNVLGGGTNTNTRTFTYDNNGNLKSDTEKDLTSTVYGRANLPTRLQEGTTFANGETIDYLYNTSDSRIQKTITSANGTVAKKEYYLKDATGRNIAIIDKDNNVEWHIYGKERLASIKTPPNPINWPQLDVKVWLQGPYNTQTGAMITDLNGRGLLPGQTPLNGSVSPTPVGQPYNTGPWYYKGNEGSSFGSNSYDQNVVDWVLFSLRTDKGRATEIFKTAALLYSDGRIELTDGINLPTELTSTPVYIVLEHRNHAGIMSPQPVSLNGNTLTHDFRTANSYTTGTGAGQKELQSGLWVMFGGNPLTYDGDLGYDINGPDKAIWSNQNGTFDEYLAADFNFDGDVNGTDKALWFNNNGNFFAVEVSLPNVSGPAGGPAPNLTYYNYDHLGNTRVAYTVDLVAGAGNSVTIDYTVSCAKDYFPFGKSLRSFGQERFLTTGHERDAETGYDYRGARFYDADISRFLSLDPKSRNYPSLSDYSYVANNPIVIVDPNGKNLGNPFKKYVDAAKAKVANYVVETATNIAVNLKEAASDYVSELIDNVQVEANFILKWDRGAQVVVDAKMVEVEIDALSVTEFDMQIGVKVNNEGIGDNSDIHYPGLNGEIRSESKQGVLVKPDLIHGVGYEVKNETTVQRKDGQTTLKDHKLVGTVKVGKYVEDASLELEASAGKVRNPDGDYSNYFELNTEAKLSTTQQGFEAEVGFQVKISTQSDPDD